MLLSIERGGKERKRMRERKKGERGEDRRKRRREKEMTYIFETNSL